jgi:hypothetical protein
MRSTENYNLLDQKLNEDSLEGIKNSVITFKQNYELIGTTYKKNEKQLNVRTVYNIQG